MIGRLEFGERRKGTFWIPFLFVLLLHGAISLRLGVVIARDTVRYAAWAEQLRSADITLLDWLAVNPGPRLLHSGFVMLIALLQSIAGERWALLLVAANVICNALTAAIVTRVTLRLTGSSGAGLVALALYALCFEIFLWVRYALSDTTFFFASTLIWLLFLDTLLRDRISFGRCVAIGGAILLALLYRPASLAFIPVALLLPLLRRGPLSRRAVAIGMFVILAAVLLHAMLLRHPDAWPIETFQNSVFKIADEFGRGEVILDRPETYIRDVDSVGDVLLVSGARSIRFFQFISGSFSSAHNAGNIFTFVPLYALFVAAVVMLTRRKLGATAERRAVALSIVWIASFTLLHSLTQLDFDWRYRLPAMAPLLICAGIGFAALRDRQSLSSSEPRPVAPPSTSR